MRILPLFFSLALIACGPALAECGPVPVEVSIDTPDPIVTTSVSYDVAAASGNKFEVNSRVPRGWHVTGLAQARPRYELKVEGQSGRGCYRPTRAQVVVGFFGPIQVTISAKYGPGSCEYENIKYHEMQHVTIYRNSIVTHRQVLLQELHTALNNLPPHVLTQPGAQQIVFQIAQGVVSRVFERMMNASKVHNAMLDTPENYKREQARCSNW